MTLKELMDERKVTVKQLAELVGVSEPAVVAWRNGRSSPYRKYYAFMAKALDVSVDALIDVLEGIRAGENVIPVPDSSVTESKFLVGTTARTGGYSKKPKAQSDEKKKDEPKPKETVPSVADSPGLIVFRMHLQHFIEIAETLNKNGLNIVVEIKK